jgi:hypothetical protein
LPKRKKDPETDDFDVLSTPHLLVPLLTFVLEEMAHEERNADYTTEQIEDSKDKHFWKVTSSES